MHVIVFILGVLLVCFFVSGVPYVLIVILGWVLSHGREVMVAVGIIVALIVILYFISESHGVVKDKESKVVNDDESKNITSEVRKAERERKKAVLVSRRAEREAKRLAQKDREVVARKKKVAELEKMLLDNAGIIDKFLEIAYRKVTVIDEYGDEDWGVLSEEILKCVYKIVQQSKKDLRWEAFEKDSDLYCSRVIKCDRAKLTNALKGKFRKYYDSKKGQTTEDINIEGVSGVEFETFFSRVLKDNGYVDVSGTSATGDQGADLIVKHEGRTIIIQAKRWESVVGNKAVQEVIGAMQFYAGDEGWVVTNSKFTQSAKALAQKAKIRLIDGDDLKEWVNKKHAVVKRG